MHAQGLLSIHMQGTPDTMYIRESDICASESSTLVYEYELYLTEVVFKGPVFFGLLTFFWKDCNCNWS